MPYILLFKTNIIPFKDTASFLCPLIPPLSADGLREGIGSKLKLVSKKKKERV